MGKPMPLGEDGRVLYQFTTQLTIVPAAQQERFRRTWHPKEGKLEKIVLMARAKQLLPRPDLTRERIAHVDRVVNGTGALPDEKIAAEMRRQHGRASDIST